MSANHSENETPIFILWVPWKPKSPNQLLYRHWRKTYENARDMHIEFACALASSPSEKDNLIAITAWVHSNLCATTSPASSASTMATSESNGKPPKCPLKEMKA